MLVWKKRQELAEQGGAFRDYKTALQELVQRTPGVTITYELVQESGPDHCRVFEMEVAVGGKVAGRGQGHSKKEAEQAAARAALESMQETEHL